MSILKEVIRERISEIKSDVRYPKTPSQEANVLANAPLALIQMGMKGKVAAYEDVLEMIGDY